MPEGYDNMEWRDPPAVVGRGKTRPGKWARLREQLRERPGTWARVSSSENRQAAASWAHNLKKRYPDIETTMRTEPDGFYVYARYIGEAS